MSNLAVLLTCYNRKEKTLCCLSNLCQQFFSNTSYSLDIFLVDDNSTDGTREEIANLFPFVHIIQGNGSLFWNRGMHLAWTTALQYKDYDYYLWLNDDTFFYPYGITRLLELSVKNEDQCIIVGSTCALENKKRVTYGGRTFKGGLLTDLKEPQYCDYFNGNIVLVPRYVYQQVGTNDPVFHHGLGDFDYALRAAKAGIYSIVAPGIFGECDTHGKIPKWKDPMVPFKERFRDLWQPNGAPPSQLFVFRRRHYGILSALVTFISNYVHVFFPSLWNLKK